MLFLAVSSLLAQSAPLVHLRVTVLDSAEQAIDLSAADFKIWDQGKPQSVLAFRHETQGLAEPLGPHEYTNRPGGAVPHHFAILFDLLNQNPSHVVETWRAVSKSISQLEAGEPVEVYFLDLQGGLVPVHVTDNHSASDNTVMDASRPKRRAQLGREEQVKETFSQIEVLAKTLSELSGRRDILWITDPVPSVYNPRLPCNGDWVDCALYVPHLAVTLAQADVTVNPLSYSGEIGSAVDPEREHQRQPVPVVDFGGEGWRQLNQSPETTPANSSIVGSVPPSQTLHPALDLAQMALLTGGRTFLKTDIRSVLKEVIKSDSSFYEIDYDPSAANWDNKFHRIHLTCERKGVKLQVRERYFALPDARDPKERMKAALMHALTSANDAADIGIRSELAPLEGGKTRVHMNICINPADIVLRDQGGKFSGAIYFLISDRGPSGPIGEPTVASFNLDFTPAQHDVVLREGIRLAQDHLMSDAAKAVRIIVLDQNTDAVGAVTMPVMPGLENRQNLGVHKE